MPAMSVAQLIQWVRFFNEIIKCFVYQPYFLFGRYARTLGSMVPKAKTSHPYLPEIADYSATYFGEGAMNGPLGSTMPIMVD